MENKRVRRKISFYTKLTLLNEEYNKKLLLKQ